MSLAKYCSQHLKIISQTVRKNCYPRLFSSGSRKFASDTDPADIFVNRNPRNLELLGIAHRRLGWRFQAPRKDFHYQLVLEKASNSLTAKVIHSSGKVVIVASTKETAINRYLKSATDSLALLNIGRIIARRCEQAGFVSMAYAHHGDPSPKMGIFRKAIEEGGIELLAENMDTDGNPR